MEDKLPPILPPYYHVKDQGNDPSRVSFNPPFNG